MKLLINRCPCCNSNNISFDYNIGYDLHSNLVINYFIECNHCGANIKSRDLQRMIQTWNEYKK